MKGVSIKYLKRNKNSFPFYTVIFIVVLLFIALELSVNIYSYYLIDLPQEETAISIEKTKETIEELNLESIKIASCSNIERERCRVLIKANNFEKIKDILEEKDINYFLYDNLEAVIYFINIRYFFIAVLVVAIIILSFVTKILIKGKIKRENSYRIKLKYLGAKRKDILVFDKHYINLLFILYYLVISLLIILVAFLFNVMDYYLANWIYINLSIIISTLYAYAIYYILLKKNVKSLE